jgi:hypothetical protein
MTLARTRLASLLALALALGPAALFAGQKAYHSCKISNGQVFSCDGTWFPGATPVYHQGAWHLCKISNGKVFSCDGTWYQGTAVVFTDR